MWIYSPCFWTQTGCPCSLKNSNNPSPPTTFSVAESQNAHVGQTCRPREKKKMKLKSWTMKFYRLNPTFCSIASIEVIVWSEHNSSTGSHLLIREVLRADQRDSNGDRRKFGCVKNLRFGVKKKHPHDMAPCSLLLRSHTRGLLVWKTWAENSNVRLIFAFDWQCIEVIFSVHQIKCEFKFDYKMSLFWNTLKSINDFWQAFRWKSLGI